MNLISLLTIVVAILIFLIIILTIMYLVISNKEKNDSKKETVIKKQEEQNFKGTISQAYTKQSIFSFMEFDKVEDNMIIQKNGERFLMIIECQGINYDLMSKVEKTSVEEGFCQFLNTLRYPIQIYVQTRTINLAGSINNYKNKVDEVKNILNKSEFKYKQMVQSGNYSEEEIKKQAIEIAKQKNLFEYGKDIIFNTERMSLNKNVLRKQYYIIIPYSKAEIGNDLFDKEEVRNMAFSELYTKAQSLVRTLSVCGVNGKILDSYELVDLLYNSYNRDEAETYGFNKDIQASYDQLYITAPDVLDKKMKALDEEIEEKAIQRAKNVITEIKSEKQQNLKKKQMSRDELINIMAEMIIKENEQYIGKDIADEAIKKVKGKGGKEDVAKEEKTGRNRKRA